jgi:hypothetical protein
MNPTIGRHPTFPRAMTSPEMEPHEDKVEHVNSNFGLHLIALSLADCS